VRQVLAADPVVPADLLALALRRDSARPFLTWYQPATGARVELSVLTFATWVAKTCGLLTDELDVTPDDVVAIRLPAHWLGPVWAQSVWTVGARLRLPGDDGDEVARVVVRDAEEPAEQDAQARDLVVVRTAPLGGPAGTAAPSGALDYGREVPGQPDRFAPLGPPGPAVLDDDLLEQARHRARAAGPRARTLVVGERFDRDVLLDALLVPLLLDGSAVLVHGSPGPDGLTAIAAAERVEVTTGRS
jgi:uncharacterized protein (TIGR03089 family)